MKIIFKSIKKLFGSPFFVAALAGAFGGMSPKLVDLVPKLFANEYPSTGYYIGLILLGIFGLVTVLIYKEIDLKKALVLGIGAPALISSFVGKTASNAESAFNIQLILSAYAQTIDTTRELKLIVNQNESSIRLNKLWLQVDSKTITYYVVRDTIFIDLPKRSERLKITLPNSKESIEIPISEIKNQKNTVVLKIKDNSFWKDFYQAFGNNNVTQYKLERLK